jgi:hypothetical protein
LGDTILLTHSCLDNNNNLISEVPFIVIISTLLSQNSIPARVGVAGITSWFSTC